jgi:8-oxo-dGTP pyrophosphatase MutT (NUDIX family)
MLIDSPSPTAPVYKVGVVLLRHGAVGQVEILIIRPHPKNPGEIPRFVLPRGSRQYQDAAGDWHDARDAATAIQHADALEPLHRTLLREAQEEAGIPQTELQRLLDNGLVRDLGAREFASRSKAPYAIHWFAGMPDAAALAAMHSPVDAIEIRWATLAEIQSLIAADAFSAGYLPVIEEGLSLAPYRYFLRE